MNRRKKRRFSKLLPLILLPPILGVPPRKLPGVEGDSQFSEIKRLLDGIKKRCQFNINRPNPTPPTPPKIDLPKFNDFPKIEGPDIFMEPEKKDEPPWVKRLFSRFKWTSKSSGK